MNAFTLSNGILVFAHLLIAIFCLYDLFTVSRRSYKPQWAAFILLVPFLSALAYRMSMKRRKTFLF
jgi:hypothetical protein